MVQMKDLPENPTILQGKNTARGILDIQYDELVELRATVEESPAAVIKKCKYTIAMLYDPAAALSVVFYEGGVLEQIGTGKSYIDMSTVDAETSSKINEAIISKGGSFLEAPVYGSKKPAEDGQLVILAAGEQVFDGHGEKHAVDFVYSHLPRFIVKDEGFPQDIERAITSVLLQNR